MEISYSTCEAIVSTLPIGLYTGRRIPIEMSKTMETSAYSPMEDKIIVSYPIIKERLKAAKECDDEEAVRSMIYHEVSHAILTPKEMRNSHACINIFEDERIETVLRHYYHGVDFRKQIYDLCGGIPKANDAEQAFFNAVRFGLGTGKVQKEINHILQKYGSLHRNSEYYGFGDMNVSTYKQAIFDLYKLIEKEFRANPQQFQPQGGAGQEGSGNQKTMDNVQGGDNNQSERQNQSGGEPVDAEGNGQNPAQFEGHEIEMSMDDLKRSIGAGTSQCPDINPEQATELESFRRTVEMIFSSFNKKNSGGSGINAYSGVFSPRAVARKDYRYFERSMSINGNNKFGTCHLNLIIDCSGSFRPNVELTNGILRVLTEMEQKNRNFSMDVAFINHRFKMCKTVADREMEAWGSNTVPANMKDILLKMQKPQTCNYNIILFDGDAMCDEYLSQSESLRRFKAFDMKQTTLITDPDNERYIKPGFSSAKVVVTTNYTDELIKHITNALTIAFG